MLPIFENLFSESVLKGVGKIIESVKEKKQMKESLYKKLDDALNSIIFISFEQEFKGNIFIDAHNNLNEIYIDFQKVFNDDALKGIQKIINIFKDFMEKPFSNPDYKIKDILPNYIYPDSFGSNEPLKDIKSLQTLLKTAYIDELKPLLEKELKINDKEKGVKCK